MSHKMLIFGFIWLAAAAILLTTDCVLPDTSDGFPGGLPIERVSVNGGGIEADNDSVNASISADGRYVSFASIASNLVAADTNSCLDIFVYDRQTDAIKRVSVDNSGNQGNDHCEQNAISADGRYVAFESRASNLVTGDTNAAQDIFVYDCQNNTIERNSVSGSGIQANGTSGWPLISKDGRYVAFNSEASNLVANDTNGVGDIFVYDRQFDSIERVSINDSGTEADASSEHAAINADGRYVAFMSWATNLVPADSNGAQDVFVYDRQADIVERISIGDGGSQGNSGSGPASLSADGRYVVFVSIATNLVAGDSNDVADVFIFDRQADTIERVSVSETGTEADAASEYATISGDGRYVAFESYAGNLVIGGTFGTTDIFIHDRIGGTIEQIIVGNSLTCQPSLSADARYVAFHSETTDLVMDDTNGAMDIFVAPVP